jgi:predicted DNA-binding antitoxin AbrB/MazE fold protein
VPTGLLQTSVSIPRTVETIYENGVLKPTGPLPLKEHEKVRVTIEPAKNWVQRTTGILNWQGSSEELQT